MYVTVIILINKCCKYPEAVSGMHYLKEPGINGLGTK